VLLVYPAYQQARTLQQLVRALTSFIVLGGRLFILALITNVR
jgi:hypothetical protein